MNKLKNKVFLTIFIILTLSCLSFIITYNVSKYIEYYNSIDNKLNMSKDSNNQGMMHDDKKDDLVFLDSTIYTISLDDNNNIKSITNNSKNNITEDKIKVLANNYLNSNNKYRIGVLYFSNYAYFYEENNFLIIMDISDDRENICFTLIISIIILILLEIIIFIACKYITIWITKPVIDAFNKQKEFVADASHELKTPLSVIMASSEALESEIENNKWLNNIKLESNRMSKLISDMLSLASTEVNNKTYEIGNLSKIVELSCLTFEGIAFENNIKLKYDIEDNIELRMDEDSIRELSEILLDNAIKHSYKKEVINISLKKDKDKIVMMVSNKGDGIVPGDEEKIFERFYRADKSRNRKENRYGLGLSIARNIVNNHNGNIKAYMEGDLTVFKIIFKK